MSEAMTNSEIEDVLSSIRRLVAQESRPAPDLRAETRVMPERLVLTAELRVGQANLTVAPANGPQTAASTPVLSQPDAGANAGPAPSVGGPERKSALSRVADLIAADAPGAGPASSFAEPFVQPDPAPVPHSEAARPPTDLEAAITELEAALGPADPAEFSARDNRDSPTEAESPVAEPPAARMPEAEIVPDDVAMIDEDDLQNLVARLVREELRGQLGERITQQVRKLVRAEIARALDDRNLLS